MSIQKSLSQSIIAKVGVIVVSLGAIIAAAVFVVNMSTPTSNINSNLHNDSQESPQSNNPDTSNTSTNPSSSSDTPSPEKTSSNVGQVSKKPTDDAARRQKELDRQRAEDEARLIAIRTRYRATRQHRLEQNDSAWARAEEKCMKIDFIQQRATCMVNSYGGSVSDYYPIWTNNAYNARVDEINATYQSECDSIGGC
ncbi:MAG: hypothetical protein LBQ11_00440 [Candidatus Nomurabacteria bacterium]|jgi:cytoskeletal protein RodZ|nr:hypothetical protein [Candidatus Nomurabacteria bacterium]